MPVKKNCWLRRISAVIIQGKEYLNNVSVMREPNCQSASILNPVFSGTIMLSFFRRRPTSRYPALGVKNRPKSGKAHSGSEEPRIGSQVLRHSLARSLVRSHYSLICLLRTACFVRAFRCAHLLAHSEARRKVNDAMSQNYLVSSHGEAAKDQ